MNMDLVEATSPALVSGLTDVDAITIYTSRLYDLGKAQPLQAAIAIVPVLISSTVFTMGLVFAAGGAALARHCAPPMLVPVAGVAFGFLPA